MPDTPGEDCGITPIQFRGWPRDACRWHDSAYSEGSYHQQNFTRAEIDRAFLNQLLLMSGRNPFKKLASYGMYLMARLFGSKYWEGVRVPVRHHPESYADEERMK